MIALKLAILATFAWIAWNAALILYNAAMIAAEWLARKVRRET